LYIAKSHLRQRTQCEHHPLVKRRFDEVEQVFTEVVTSPVASNLDGISLLKSRGDFLARRGRFKEAAADLTRVIEFEPDESSQYHKLAPLLVASGEVERYRQLCHRIVAKFGASLDKAIADPMAKSCAGWSPVGSTCSSVTLSCGKPWLSLTAA
jgi:hypothetical protein